MAQLKLNISNFSEYETADDDIVSSKLPEIVQENREITVANYFPSVSGQPDPKEVDDDWLASIIIYEGDETSSNDDVENSSLQVTYETENLEDLITMRSLDDKVESSDTASNKIVQKISPKTVKIVASDLQKLKAIQQKFITPTNANKIEAASSTRMVKEIQQIVVVAPKEILSDLPNDIVASDLPKLKAIQQKFITPTNVNKIEAASSTRMVKEIQHIVFVAPEEILSDLPNDIVASDLQKLKAIQQKFITPTNANKIEAASSTRMVKEIQQIVVVAPEEILSDLPNNIVASDLQKLKAIQQKFITPTNANKIEAASSTRMVEDIQHIVIVTPNENKSDFTVSKQNNDNLGEFID
jgi:hypothetical protein